MKRTLAFLSAALLAFGVNAATLLPIQLLNPAGSTNGQAIISTGASSAPAWGGVPVGGLAAIAANSVIGNATNASAIPTAVTVTGCNGAAQALQWTNGSGFGCNSSVATSGANTNITSLSSPTITTPNITGVTSGAAAAVGSVGEQPAPATGTAVSLTNAIQANCATKTLTAGMYMLYGSISFNPAGGTTMTAASAGISTTSATVPAVPLYAAWSGTAPAGSTEIFAVPTQVVNVSASTTYFLVGVSNFTGSTATMTCQLNALRVH